MPLPVHMKLKSVYDNLSAMEKKVADFIMNNPDAVPNMIVSDIAECSGVSVPTVIRLSRKLGYTSFRDFRVALAISQQLEDGDYIPISEDDSDAQLVHKVFSGSIQALVETEKSLNMEDLSELAELLCRSRRVMLYGVGASGSLCRDFNYMMNFLNIVTVTTTEPDMAKIQAAHLGEGDVFIGISRSGTTNYTLEALDIAYDKGADCVFITNYLNSPAKEKCRYFFCTSRTEDQFAIGHRDSNVPHYVLLMALYLLIARKKLSENNEGNQFDFQC